MAKLFKSTSNGHFAASIHTTVKANPKPHYGGKLALLSVCSLSFMLLFILKLSSEGSPGNFIQLKNIDADSVAAMSKSANENEDEPGDEELGKLQLVQLPSLLEIFAPSDSPILPLAVEISSIVVDDESGLARIYAESGTEVVAMLKGTVKSVTNDDAFGGCVCVKSEGDIEISYYGLSNICVEKGQPIAQNSMLGVVSNDLLCIKITKAGRPIDAFDFLGIKAEVG